MMKKQVAAVLLLLTASASHAFAGDDDSAYIGVNGGTTSSDYPSSQSPRAWSVQGGLLFNKNFALELQYAGFGNIAPAGSMKPASLSLSGLGIVPITERFSLFGKLGFATVGTKISGSGIAGVDGTYRKSAATYGIGGQFHFNEAFSVRFGVDRYSTGGTQGGMTLNNGTLTVTSIGVQFQN